MKRIISYLLALAIVLSFCPGVAPQAAATADLPTANATTLSVAEKSQSSGFEVHFIDVGQADAALILCDGKAMLIDGGNVDDSSIMYTYLQKHNISYLDYVIGTHAHEDHIGGIAGALNYATAGTVYCPVTTYTTTAFSNFVKAVQKQGLSITVPSVGTTFSLGSATCKILAVNTESEPNNSSIVMRITYGETSFLFTGDAEREVEEAILNRGETLKSTVLKVGHHGSRTSTSYLWLREIMPEYAIISVGADNTYGHPTEEVLSRLRDADVKTYRTDMQGDIVCVSDGTTVTVTPSKNANADTLGGIGGNSTQKPTDGILELTVDTMGIPNDKYYTGSATAEGINLNLTEIGNYGNGIQMRDKNGKTSVLLNTTALPGKITKIELAYSATKSVSYANQNAVIFGFGTAKGSVAYTAKLSTKVGQKAYTIIPQGDFTYFRIEHDLDYTFYWDNIKVYYEVEEEMPYYEAFDVSGDGKVDSADGLLLLRRLNGWDVDISFEALDVNNDGKVDSLDGLLLLRHLNGWTVTLE